MSENKRVITLTDRAPVRITESAWTVIAGGDHRSWDGEHECQANRTTAIVARVRQHADGRALVYATYIYDTKFRGEKSRCYRAGILLDAGADIVAAIREVAATLTSRSGELEAIRDCANECIADLPPLDLIE